MKRLSLIFLIAFVGYSKDLKSFISKKLELQNAYSKTHLKYVMEGRPIVKVNVTTPKKKRQKIDEMMMVYHKKSCKPVINKMNQYENYVNFFDFIKKSNYKNGYMFLKIRFFLVPRDFMINVKIDRLNEIKSYPFVFNTGFLDGLKGILDIREFNNRCLFNFKMDWEGERTGLSNFILENFMHTIAKYGLRKMLLMTGHGKAF